MNIHYAFSIREVSEVIDSEQTLEIPMYFTVAWMDDRLVVDQGHRAWKKSTTGSVTHVKHLGTEKASLIFPPWLFLLD